MSNAALGEGEMRELRALLEKATPAPWRADSWTDGHPSGWIYGPNGERVAVVHLSRGREDTNYALIAALRNLPPRILDTLASRDAEAARLRQLLERAADRMTSAQRGCICHCPVLDGHTGDCEIVAALSCAAAGAGSEKP